MQERSKGYAAELVTLRTGRELPDLLREYYVERRYTQREVADALGVSRSQVRDWLAEHGISREDRAPLAIEAVG